MPLAPAEVRGCRGAAQQLPVQLEILYAPVPRLRGTAAELPTHQLGRAVGALEVAQGKLIYPAQNPDLAQYAHGAFRAPPALMTIQSATARSLVLKHAECGSRIPNDLFEFLSLGFFLPADSWRHAEPTTGAQTVGSPRKREGSTKKGRVWAVVVCT